jgi:tetratricopeptide (TPR) repeat protein
VCTAALALAGCGGAPPAQGPVANGPAVAAPAEVAKPAPPTPAPMPTDEAGLRARLAASPGDAAALSLLSKILWDAHRFDEGVALLEAARAANPALPEELLWALALHHDALGHTDVADSIATSLEAHVTDWSRDGSAATFLRLRRDASPDAESVARKALEAESSAANQNNLGIALLYAGKPEEARKLFLKANDKDPRLPGPLYNLAIVDRFYLFDDATARQWFDKYRALASDDPDSLAAQLAVKVATGAPSNAGGK